MHETNLTKCFQRAALSTLSVLVAIPASAALLFSNGNVSNQIAAATRPSDATKFEIETADDFLLTTNALVTSATFTGLITGGATTANIGEVVVEIYRVFPTDSDVGRTSGPPTFSTPNVITRNNSPSDVAFADRDSAVVGELTFATNVLSGSFSTLNSVQPGGIHAKPNQATMGNGAVSGEEVEFDVTFTTPFLLPPDHYFFVPQVEVTTPTGEFLWLSAVRPIVAPGTPFAPDLQSWTRDEVTIAPDWLRVGTDIVDGTTAPTFNAAFTLTGTVVPEPAQASLLAAGLMALAWTLRRNRTRSSAARL